MAKFGLSDSEDEVSDTGSIDQEEQGDSQTEGDSTSRSISVPLSDDEGVHSDEDQDEEDAPPRASLLSEDEDLGDSQEEDDSMDQLEPPPRSTHSRSRSHSHFSRQSTRTPSPPPPTNTSTRRKQLQIGQNGPTSSQQQQSPWAQQLHLEPKRVQVMQASLFGQAPTRDKDHNSRERDRDELEKEREGKRRAVEQGFAQRVAQARSDKSSLFPTPSTPAPAASSAPQPSAAQPVPTPILDPTPFRPYRTYSRVPLADSVVQNSQQSLVDSGLALGRSYRVGWGTNGEMVSLHGVYDKKETKSDVLKVEKLKLLSNEDKKASLRLLELQLQHSEIYASSHTDPSSDSPVPFASPLPSLRFSHFAQLFSEPSSSSTDPSSSSSAAELQNSPEAQLFKLASYLFDEVSDLGLSDTLDLSFTTPSYQSTITSLRRRDLLSNWLSTSLLPSISTSLHDPSLSPIEKIFLLLTTHDLSRACDLSISSQNLRLATLISQIGTISSSSTDLEFQKDLTLQLEKWKEYKVDSHVSVGVRKVYELLSGNLGISKGSQGGGKEDESKEFHVLEGVEWKAAFAMGLWYARNQEGDQEGGGSGQDEVERAMRAYEQSFEKYPSRVANPLPHYQSSPAGEVTSSTPLDPIYHLLKLYTSPTHSLERSLSPLNFGPSPTDYRLPWHLYLLFSRVLRKRDFEDRLEIGTTASDDGMMMVQGEDKEGNSVRADQVTTSYAIQLESIGMWEWSAFVLLHLELEIPRAQAIQELLTRHITSLTPSLTSFLLETLKLPPFYLDRARAIHSQSIGDVFSTYKYMLASEESSKAHRIAVEELCPEAIVRGDYELVRRLLEPFREDEEEEDENVERDEGDFRGTVEGWDLGGRVYLQYLHTLSVFSSSSSSPLGPTTSSSSYLSRTIESLQRFKQFSNETKRLRDNKKLKMALSEMSSRLNVLSRVVGGKALNVTQPSLLGESDKLVWLQGATQSFLDSSLKRAGGGTAVMV